MPETTAPETTAPDGVPDPAPLSNWSRAVAGLAGFTLCSAGTIAVFRTENQAGCVALILAGVLFVILSIGGNPLHSLGFGEAQMRFAIQRRRREVIASVSEASPEEAQRTLDVLRTIDPGVVADVSFRYQSARTYEELAKQRFLHLFPDCAISGRSTDFATNVDFVVHRPEDKIIGVDALFIERLPGIGIGTIAKRVERASISIVPTLIMSNVQIGPATQAYLERARSAGTRIQYVLWQDERHDTDLLAAAEELFEPAP